MSPLAMDRLQSSAAGPDPPAGWRSRAHPPGKAASVATGLALFFLVLALLALALGPTYLDQDVWRIQEQIQEVLAPAERLAADLERGQMAQMAALEAFLTAGEGQARQRYRSAQASENRAIEGLQDLVPALPLEARAGVQQQLTRVLTLSFAWHLRHQPVLNEDVPREALLLGWSAEREAHQELVRASGALREALTREASNGLARVARARTAQARFTRILAGVGLGATLAVVLLGLRLRRLMVELEERRADAQRARREADALLEATGDGVLGMDMEGRCTFLNRAGAELLGYPARQVVGKEIHALLHHSRADGSPLPRDECPVVRALGEGAALSGRNDLLWRAGGSSFPVQVSLRPLREGPALKGAVLTFTDMTEARANEASLVQALRARDEVLAVVSHDLRNPVGTIYSAAGLLLDMDLPREKEREHLRTLQRSAQRMSRLIQDLLDVARLEAGGLRASPGRFAVSGLLGEVAEGFRAMADEVGVRMEVRDPGQALEGWGDRDRVLQVLSNLVENALKFTPTGGEVEVGAERQAGEAGDVLHVWVADTGPGIAPADLDRLFDRFWQVSRRDKRGAGLGLSIVKGLVEAQGGRVWVESREGLGSTFHFTLPAPADPFPSGDPGQ